MSGCFGAVVDPGAWVLELDPPKLNIPPVDWVVLEVVLPNAKMLLSFGLFSAPPKENTAGALVCGADGVAVIWGLLDGPPKENEASTFGAS